MQISLSFFLSKKCQGRKERQQRERRAEREKWGLRLHRVRVERLPRELMIKVAYNEMMSAFLGKKIIFP